MLDRMSGTLAVVAFCQRHSLPADVVGRWVWVKFTDKPSAETRGLLKANGFRWVKRRAEWAHCCGVKSTQARGYRPRDKYGSVPVGSFAGESEAA